MMRLGERRLKKVAPGAVTWLHLSDVHLCPEKTGWDAVHVLHSLRKDFRHMQAEHGLHPDLIFFSGDLAFGDLPGSPLHTQFAEGARFLKGVRESFDPPVAPSAVYLVPGNHDVNRNFVGRPETFWLDWLKGETGAAEVSNLLRDKNLEWRRCMERLADYRRFLETPEYTHLLMDPDRLVYVAKPIVSRYRIGIAGFNTAWSCSREEEDGKLWLGRWQIETLHSQLEDCDFRIALTHHPLTWLRKEEDPALRRQVERSFDFHLHGHEHQDWADEMNHHVRVAAGACYENSQKENGYSFARIFPLKGSGEIFLRRYDKTGGGWVGRIVHGRTDHDGRWELGLNWLNPTLQRKIDQAVQVIKREEVLPITGIEADDSGLPAEEIAVESVPSDREFTLPPPKLNPPLLPRWAGETVRIFLASSSELREDRDALDLYIREQNDRLHEQGHYLKVDRWEYFLDAMSPTRLQDEYNRAVRNCDIFVCLFFTKAGPYTDEEFEVAYQQFRTSGKPRIYTYFKNADFKTGKARKDDFQSLWAFQEKLERLGHFHTSYDNLEGLKLHFRDQLDRVVAARSPGSKVSPRPKRTRASRKGTNLRNQNA